MKEIMGVKKKKKIKIIDILCYISTGDYDKLPEEFEYAGYYWFWCLSCLTYETRDENKEEINLYDYLARNGDLNDEVEISDIEDEFEDIEEIELIGDGSIKGYYNGEVHNITTNVKDKTVYIKLINQLIRNQKLIINKLKEEGN